MALDRSFDDGADRPDGQPEQQLRRCGTGGDAPRAQPEPAEQRSHAEYYEALRAADSGSAEDREVTADTRKGHSGWDAVDAEERPSPDGVRASPERTTHILDGDSYGGGHRHGVGKPGKTEFPAIWDDQKIITNVIDVAQRPDSPPVYQHRNDRWICSGTRDRVEASKSQ